MNKDSETTVPTKIYMAEISSHNEEKQEKPSEKLYGKSKYNAYKNRICFVQR